MGAAAPAQSGCSDLPVAQVTSRVRVYSGFLCCALASRRAEGHHTEEAPSMSDPQEMQARFFFFNIIEIEVEILA